MCIDLETTADSVSKTVLDGESDGPSEYVDSDVDLAVYDSDVVDVELKLWPRTVRLAAPLADSDDENKPADSVGKSVSFPVGDANVEEGAVEGELN